VYYGSDHPIRTLADANERVRLNAEYFASETYKVFYDRTTDRRTQQLLAMAARDYGLNATVHAGQLQTRLANIIDGFTGSEHAQQVPIYGDVATLIALSGTTITTTYGASVHGAQAYMIRRYGWPLTSSGFRRFVPLAAYADVCAGDCTGETAASEGPMAIDNLLPLLRGSARIAHAGGRVALGAHGDIPGLGEHYEMWLEHAGGMTNAEILRSATIVGAAAIGHSHDLGSIEPGKLADLQVLDRNPLEDIHNTISIRYVMKNGVLYDTKLTEIWPAHRQLAHVYIQNNSSDLDPAASGGP
jgi:imidazolonepropionase-like amidohydrolase